MVLAYINIVYLASSYIPGNNNNPLKAIKVSLPQDLAQPVEKWGSPAEIEYLKS